MEGQRTSRPANSDTTIRALKLVAVTCAVLAASLYFAACGSSPEQTNVNITTAPTPESPANLEFAVLTESDEYSSFSHSSSAHAQVDCLLCHARETDSAKLDLPGRLAHSPCAGCHVEQFSSPKPNPASKMCSICHTDAEAGALKEFPPLRSFNVKFDHSRHLRITDCTTCHAPMRQAASFSMPRGSAAHTTCFACHTAQEPIGTCNTCHTPGTPKRSTPRNYAGGFSHRDHTGRAGLSCTSCHTIRPGSMRSGQVGSPVFAMHFPAGRATSCATCHNGKRAFGGNDFTNCKLCHEGSNFSMP